MSKENEKGFATLKITQDGDDIEVNFEGQNISAAVVLEALFKVANQIQNDTILKTTKNEC